MEKKILHRLLETIPTSMFGSPTEETILKINFLQEHKPLSGDYKVLSCKLGRGKHGSRVLSLMNMESGEELTHLTVKGKKKGIGSPTSDHILNVTMNDTLYGNTSENDLPSAYPRSELAAKHLNRVMEPLVKSEGKRVEIVATESSFNGTWQVISGRKSPGRYGQIVLELKDGERTAELWAYRHSGIVKSLTVL